MIGGDGVDNLAGFTVPLNYYLGSQIGSSRFGVAFIQREI